MIIRGLAKEIERLPYGCVIIDGFHVVSELLLAFPMFCFTILHSLYIKVNLVIYLRVEEGVRQSSYSQAWEELPGHRRWKAGVGLENAAYPQTHVHNVLCVKLKVKVKVVVWRYSLNHSSVNLQFTHILQYCDITSFLKNSPERKTKAQIISILLQYNMKNNTSALF